MTNGETTSWDYHPDDGNTTRSKSSPTVAWRASEYIDHKQGPAWFAALALATIALAAGFYFLTHDYFAVAVVIIVGLIVGVFARRTPRELQYEISAKGLKIEDKLYPINHFKSFSIFREGPICSLELLPLKRFMPAVSAYFEAADQDKVVAVLENYLPLEERSPDLSDRLSRRLRF